MFLETGSSGIGRYFPFRSISLTFSFKSSLFMMIVHFPLSVSRILMNLFCLRNFMTLFSVRLILGCIVQAWSIYVLIYQRYAISGVFLLWIAASNELIISEVATFVGVTA